MTDDDDSDINDVDDSVDDSNYDDCNKDLISYTMYKYMSMMEIMVNCYDNDDCDNHDNETDNDHDVITHLNNNKPRSAQLIVI